MKIKQESIVKVCVIGGAIASAVSNICREKRYILQQKKLRELEIENARLNGMFEGASLTKESSAEN